MPKQLNEKQRASREAELKTLKSKLKRRGPLTFGSLRILPSGRVQARHYAEVDGQQRRFTAPRTWDNISDAEAWLATTRAHIETGHWVAPDAAAAQKRAATLAVVEFGTYADAWLHARNLKPRTRAHYRQLLDAHILPTFANVPIREITPTTVRAWHTNTLVDRPTARSHAYSLMHAICSTAVAEEVIDANPCRVRGASNTRRAHNPDPLSLNELDALATAMPERRQLLVLLAAWCGLRFGELTELRRSDLYLKGPKAPSIEVRRAVTRVPVEGRTTVVVGKPKSDAGVRDVAVPPHLVPAIVHHLDKFVGKSSSSLVFPANDGSSHLAPSAFYGKSPKKSRNRRTGKTTMRAGHGFYAARVAIGRPDLRQHDLRHTGAVLAAQTGATLAELMSRMGHSTPGAAMRYQHAAQGRDAQIANLLSTLAANNTQSEESAGVAERSGV